MRDAVITNNSIDLKASQYTAYLTFGLTSRIDVSLVIPLKTFCMGLRSNDTIVLHRWELTRLEPAPRTR